MKKKKNEKVIITCHIIHDAIIVIIVIIAFLFDWICLNILYIYLYICCIYVQLMKIDSFFYKEKLISPCTVDV
jgi:hypothetical protein